MTDKRIPMEGLEINVIYACNLKCEYCTHLGKYLDGYVPMGDMTSWYQSWHEKLRPQVLTILGGEPLMHPNLAEILYLTKEYWKDSEIQMVTNGILLPEASEDILTALAKTDTLVSMSQHFNTKGFQELFVKCSRRLESYRVRHTVRSSYSWWMKSHRLDESGKILPYSSDPERAWNNCFVKHSCRTLMDNRIYKCPQLACFRRAYQTGLLSEEWRFLLGYEALAPDASDVDIRKFFDNASVPECRLCPEMFESVTAEEKQGCRKQKEPT